MSTARDELREEWRPTNMVLAVLPDQRKTEAASAALQEAGFGEAEVALLRGQEAAELLDLEGKRSAKGLGRPLHAIWSYLSIEAPELRAYEEASQAGKDVIAVKAFGDDQVAKVREVLARFEAAHIRYFTDWNVSDLSED